MGSRSRFGGVFHKFANFFTKTRAVYVINLSVEEAELMYMSILALTKNLESVWND